MIPSSHRFGRIANGPVLYCLWATLAIGFSISLAGFSPESITRLLVLGFLGIQMGLRSALPKAGSGLSPRLRFVGLGTCLAAVVEGFHMISTPVFPSLRIGTETGWMQGFFDYGIDLLLTIPAYLAIFSVIWRFIVRYRFTLWQYVVLMGLGQALGDGGLWYFVNAPAMLFFLPYPMTNYHAINVLPFLAVRENLPRDRPMSAARYLAVPTLIGVYAVCGTIIKLVGRAFGLEAA